MPVTLMNDSNLVIRELLALLTHELVEGGARAVVLMGSYARGDAADHSDIDLTVVGDGAPSISLRNGIMVVIGWSKAETLRADFTEPLRAGAAIPGWWRAIILNDPDGVAAQLQDVSQRWTWNDVGQATCDAAVAREMAGLAEEVHKLVNGLNQHRQTMAAVQRNILVLRMAGIMALHHRMLYESENRLWDEVAACVGGSWAAAQARAMGLHGEPFAETCAAALELYALSARDVLPLLDSEQRAVVTHACRIAGHSLE
ncbi:MAG: nucleotidyltransferase domain-containing protein [Chloroflexi bacterium]|nr:MAG: nucleotidyltransferase domain-containing protein [Chloroflexota bacterium]